MRKLLLAGMVALTLLTSGCFFSWHGGNHGGGGGHEREGGGGHEGGR